MVRNSACGERERDETESNPEAERLEKQMMKEDGL